MPVPWMFAGFGAGAYIVRRPSGPRDVRRSMRISWCLGDIDVSGNMVSVVTFKPPGRSPGRRKTQYSWTLPRYVRRKASGA